MVLICKTLNFIQPRMLCAKFGWKGPMFCRRRFSDFGHVFSFFVIISPWKRMWHFIWTNLNPFHPRMLCAKFGWNWPYEFFLNFVNVFSLFRNYLPLDKSVALYFNKLESLSPKDALCQVRSKFTQWIWRRRWKCEKFTDGRTDSRTFHAMITSHDNVHSGCRTSTFYLQLFMTNNNMSLCRQIQAISSVVNTH